MNLTFMIRNNASFKVMGCQTVKSLGLIALTKRLVAFGSDDRERLEYQSFICWSRTRSFSISSIQRLLYKLAKNPFILLMNDDSKRRKACLNLAKKPAGGR